jgi:hypothetical protein
VYREFTLWKDALINGELRLAGMDSLLIRDSGVTKYPARGGDLAKYLYPFVIADEKQRNPQVAGSEAWGWLPPPLAGEGLKVQPEWLHSFLLSPYRIRPAAVLRMPAFNMSSDEASKLVNYFAAIDGAEYPFEFNRRQGPNYLVDLQQSAPDRLAQAFKIVISRDFCVQCHLVGDYAPDGANTSKAPNLDQIYRRLRPEYVHRWVGNPKRILPYTGMPVNIRFAENEPNLGGVDQALYSGTSVEQLGALVELLMNYDSFTSRQISIRDQVPPAAGGDQPGAPTGGAPAEDTADAGQ